MLQIERAGVKDHGVVTSLLLEFSRAQGWRPEVDRDRWDRIIAELLNSERWLFLIAYDDDEPVGMAVVSFRLSLYGSREEARLVALVVEEDNRRRGIGTELMDSVVSAARRRDCRELEARVAPEEKSAIAFCDRFSNVEKRLLLTWPYDK